MAQTLETLSIISFVVAALFLALAVFFWIFFRIPTVIGDLSGRTARKSIAQMRGVGTKTGAKHKSSKTNISRGKLTETMSDLKKDTESDDKPETGLLSENKAEDTESDVTGILDEETATLDTEATGLLADENETAPLNNLNNQRPVRVGGKKLEIIENIMLIHTDEVIGWAL